MIPRRASDKAVGTADGSGGSGGTIAISDGSGGGRRPVVSKRAESDKVVVGKGVDAAAAHLIVVFRSYNAV
ncbi:MAG: hypothetical protein EXS11_10440 [Gemmataceae bacterium]|nr:hypothetical protein [Gemmataceae bacterium]